MVFDRLKGVKWAKFANGANGEENDLADGSR
jgi:hypothetical protein